MIIQILRDPSVASELGSAINCVDLDGDGYNTDLLIGAWDDPGNAITEPTQGHFYIMRNDYE